MKALVYERYGKPDDLEIREVEKPRPEAGEVLIRVRAASINSWDWDLLVGKPWLMSLGGRLTPQFHILGADVAGTVEAVGDAVERFKPGDEVFGDLSRCGWGAFAEYVCAAEAALAYKPSSMSYEEAAATPQAGVLALQGLRDKGRIQKGDRVLINGAGGGVGTFAIQIAKSYGAEVTGVDSAEKLEIVRSTGADHTIDYRRENFAAKAARQEERRYDLVLDMVANRSIFAYARTLERGGRYVMVGGPLFRMSLALILAPLASKPKEKEIGILMHRANSSDLETLGKLHEDGSVKPVIGHRFPLAEAPDAFRLLGDGRAEGKIVIVVGR